MATTSRTIDATPHDVWKVLSDGWLYPLWVVGASRIRAVDDSWPSTGARIHHSVGLWPLLIDDHTAVTDVEPQSSLSLRARAWPAGEAAVVIRLRPEGAGTVVTIEEDAASGPGVLVPRPLRDVSLAWRNVETLRRLAFVAERRP